MKKYISLFLVLIMSSMSYAAEHEGTKHKMENALGLSEAISDLLKQEMNEIKKGMESLILSIASGDWQKITETGKNIKHSYIMKNKLTKVQRHELHKTLPKQFKEIDKKFHYYAGMLSHVAAERDAELVNFYFYKMNESCVACHSKFVKNRFEGFKSGNKHEKNHH